jgi:hypothetical protein
MNVPGWKRFKRYAKREKILQCVINQAKVRQVKTRVKFKFGYEVPKNYAQAIELDVKNNNTEFEDAVEVEM